MDELCCNTAAAQARDLLAAARSRLPWLKRAGVLPGGCPEDRDAWNRVFRAAGVTILWPELCEAEQGVVIKAHRLVELGAEIVIACTADASRLATAGLLAPVFPVGE